MAGPPYIQKVPWPAFVYQEQTYDLAHLDEYVVTVEDSAHVQRRIAVTFADHCFTRHPEPGDDPALLYLDSGRPFCIDRYHHARGLRTHLEQATGGNVWVVAGENYAVVPIVDHQGRQVDYGIFFSLDPVKGLPVHLHLRVHTAYPVTDQALVTFGKVRFRHLVYLRLRHERPGRIAGHRRQTP